jgi:hypothetical protein
MGFVQRAFTPPGTGGQEAAAQLQAISAAKAAAPPTAPTAPAPPTPPPQFMPGQAPGAKQQAATTSTMLGAAAATGQTSKKSLLGQ